MLRDRHLASQSETGTKTGQSELRSDKIESDQFYLNERKKILRKDFENTHFSFASESEFSQLENISKFSKKKTFWKASKGYGEFSMESGKTLIGRNIYALIFLGTGIQGQLDINIRHKYLQIQTSKYTIRVSVLKAVGYK